MSGPAVTTVVRVMSTMGMDAALVRDILSGAEEDLLGLRWKQFGMVWTGNIGLALLWIAAVLTVVTGWDYVVKGVRHIAETERASSGKAAGSVG